MTPMILYSVIYVELVRTSKCFWMQDEATSNLLKVRSSEFWLSTVLEKYTC